MKADYRVVLEQLRDLLWMFGFANDAQDHDCAQEAERLRSDATAGIHKLM